MRARARAETAILVAPRVHVQALRNPSTLEIGPTLTERLQLRVGASWSPLETWQGARVLDASAADCSLHELAERAERVTSYSSDAPLVAAYRMQAEALTRTREERERIARRVEERLRDNVITRLEFHEFERLANVLRRREEEVLGIVQRLHAEGVDQPPRELAELAQQHARGSAKLEEREAAVRAFEPWKVRISGGVIPSQGRDVDWYGWLELSYSLGGPAFVRGERRYLAARAEELRTARYELPARIAVLRGQIESRVAQARRELHLVDRQLAFINTTLRTLESTELAAVAHARDALAIERMLAESERAFLLALIESLSPLGSEGHVATN